jgi:uncharacterized membrane protein
VLAIVGTAAYLLWQYPSLPDLLPVHFRWDSQPNGWQFRTLPRVLMPMLVQVGLLASLGATCGLLLFRNDALSAMSLPEAAAARIAAEAVMSTAAVWVGFQAYAAFALVRLWTHDLPTLGRGYTTAEIICLTWTVVIGVRAARRLGRPGPVPYVPEHWRLGQLYCNADDPALFAPTRDGSRWTLNFGRPAAVTLLGGTLVAGIVVPTLLLALALR